MAVRRPPRQAGVRQRISPACRIPPSPRRLPFKPGRRSCPECLIGDYRRLVRAMPRCVEVRELTMGAFVELQNPGRRVTQKLTPSTQPGSMEQK